MEKDPMDELLKTHLGGEAPAEVHARASVHFKDLAESIAKQPASGKFPRRPLLWFWAGASLSGALALAALAAVFLFSPAPSWAQVAEKFRNLKFFNATVFFTSNVGQSPEKIDLWVAQDHRLRAHYRGLIFFGSEGQITKIVSADSGTEIPIDELKFELRTQYGDSDTYPALTLLRGIARFSEEPEFSIDHLLLLISGKREQLQPTLNTDGSTFSDLQVFDFSTKSRPEWVRLWALKKSDLPLRVRVWDPCDGGQTDLIFDYANQMPEDAFDSGKVQSALQKKQGIANRLYALLPDSGGQPNTPEQLFSLHGYHLPEIDTVGRTPEGVIWILSRNAENRRSDGERIVGWGLLSDNLGQTYTRRLIGWLADDNTLLEYFVPNNLGTTFIPPTNYTLTCTDTPDTLMPSANSGKSIGSVQLNAWHETPTIPDLVRAQQNQISGRTNWQLVEMDEAIEKRDWAKFEATANAILGRPETDLTALARDVKRAHQLCYTQQREAAAVLCNRLYPIISDGVKQGQPYYINIIRWHIADLFRKGQRIEARTLANRHAAEALDYSKAGGPQFIVDLLLELRLAGLTETETKTFFNHNIISQHTVRLQLEKSRLFQSHSLGGPNQGLTP